MEYLFSKHQKGSLNGKNESVRQYIETSELIDGALSGEQKGFAVSGTVTGAFAGAALGYAVTAYD